MNIKQLEADFLLPANLTKGTIYDSFYNLFTKDEFEVYADDVFALMQESYKDVGGLLNIKTVDDLMAEGDFWKLVVRNGHVYAAAVYKKTQYGRKAKLMGTDGSAQGKKDLLTIMSEDVREVSRGAYYEVSEAPEHILKTKFGMTPIPVEDVPKIINKSVTPTGDGYHYKRDVGGLVKEKILLGNPKTK